MVASFATQRPPGCNYIHRCIRPPTGDAIPKLRWNRSPSASPSTGPEASVRGRRVSMSIDPAHNPGLRLRRVRSDALHQLEAAIRQRLPFTLDMR
jgi:hypothetical protein